MVVQEDRKLARRNEAQRSEAGTLLSSNLAYRPKRDIDRPTTNTMFLND